MSTDARTKFTRHAHAAQGLPRAVTSAADAGGVQPVTTYGFTPHGHRLPGLL